MCMVQYSIDQQPKRNNLSNILCSSALCNLQYYINLCVPICVGNTDAANRDKLFAVISVHTNPCCYNVTTFQYLINFLVDFPAFWYGHLTTTRTTVILCLKPNASFITKIVTAVIDIKPVTRTNEA